MRHYSPLRYPGGKACLASFLDDVISLNELDECSYYEPFAGGAGAALRLLMSGSVSRLFLNDADIRVYAFWRACLHHSSEFADKVLQIPLTIDEWKRQKEICARPRSQKMFDLGFAAFYLNRCNRSGIILGAGPIGGYKQEGRWGVDARFSRADLAARVLRLGKLRKSIHVSNQDAVRFLVNSLPVGTVRRNVLVYLDPPYVENGRRLYMSCYDQSDHRFLSAYILRQKRLHWIMSYDNHETIKQLYERCRISAFSLQYSLQTRGAGDELLITPRHLSVPHFLRLGHRDPQKLEAHALGAIQ